MSRFTYFGVMGGLLVLAATLGQIQRPGTGSLTPPGKAASGGSLFRMDGDQVFIPMLDETTVPQPLATWGEEIFEPSVYRNLQQAIFVREARTKPVSLPEGTGKLRFLMRADPVEDLFPRVEIVLNQGGETTSTHKLFEGFVEATAVQSYEVVLPELEQGKPVVLAFKILNSLDQDDRTTVYVRQIEALAASAPSPPK